MSSDIPNPPSRDIESESGATLSQDLVLNLDFVPTWARKPAENPYSHLEERSPGDRRSERALDRAQGVERRGKSRRVRPRERAARKQDRAAPPRLPVRISFLPERHQLSALVRQLVASQKAYPLSYLAHLLLAKPEYHAIKIEAHGDIVLYRFKPDGAVFLDPESLRAHAICRLLSELFDESIEQTDAPAGQFTCVGRCTLSGEWLGPPNYHGYQERLLDLHRTRFPHMKIDEYRAHIEMVKDPEAIEQWKAQARTRRVYRPKGQPEAKPLSREEAVLQLLQHHLPDWQESGRRFIMPATRVRELPEGPLRRLIEETWQREHRNPFTMNLALRPAFRHMKLHIFKAGRGEPFVTAIAPRPLDATHAVENIRAMLNLLREHPGWDRARLVEHLKPGLDPASEEARELLAPLRWLIEKGHVIEFFDGTLSAPSPKPPPAAPAG